MMSHIHPDYQKQHLPEFRLQERSHRDPQTDPVMSEGTEAGSLGQKVQDVSVSVRRTAGPSCLHTTNLLKAKIREVKHGDAIAGELCISLKLIKPDFYVTAEVKLGH
uniref:Uncharacterized protein n=1 Tax=Nothobranchius kadleci TaxID=1051664 RepID=A0A1A8E2C4_NOTKA